MCGATESLEFAHLVARSEGGPKDCLNIVWLCRRHHIVFDKSVGVIGGALAGAWLAEWRRHAPQFTQLIARREVMLDRLQQERAAVRRYIRAQPNPEATARAFWQLGVSARHAWCAIELARLKCGSDPAIVLLLGEVPAAFLEGMLRRAMASREADGRAPPIDSEHSEDLPRAEMEKRYRFSHRGYTAWVTEDSA